MHGAFLLFGVAVSAMAAARADDFVPMGYNHPGLRVELKGGFAATAPRFVTPGKGPSDLVLSSTGVNDWSASWLCRWRGDHFAAPVRRGERIPWLDRPASFDRLPANVHLPRMELNRWQALDYDGDGLDDAVISLSDRVSTYGWDNAWTSGGVWTNGPMHGLVFWMRNLGPKDAPNYAPARPVMLENRLPLETYGNAWAMFEDWDRDGDLDVVATDVLGDFLYFENVGSRTAPVYTSGRLLHDADGRLIETYSYPSAVSRDWDADGHPDILASDNAGYVTLLRNTGRLRNGAPVFERPRRFLQEADKLGFGDIAMASGCDWDGDGDWDLVVGDEAGRLVWFENLSGRGVESPRWSAPQPLAADGVPLVLDGGYNMSVQGPSEAKFGYPTPYVADWDGDGLPDLLVSVISGDVIWYRNVGTRGKPALTGPFDVEVDWEGPQPELAWGWYKPRHKRNPKGLLTQWRVTPCAFDWNRDGLVDLVMVDQEGYLAFFARRRDAKGGLRLSAPRRIFLGENGRPLHPTNVKGAGSSGRIKHAICDWDGDGLYDLLVVGGRNVLLYRQLETRADGTVRFAKGVPLGQKDLQRHNPQPTVVDFNGDGTPDLVLNDEAGYFHYLRNPHGSARNPAAR